MNILKKEYFTIILALLLLIIIVLSKNNINNNSNNSNFFYLLIIINLLIIISCLVDLTKNYIEKFNSGYKIKNNNCFQRSKEYDTYNFKIDTRLNKLRELEINDRKYNNYIVENNKDENNKLKELNIMNLDYLANGEL